MLPSGGLVPVTCLNCGQPVVARLVSRELSYQPGMFAASYHCGCDDTKLPPLEVLHFEVTLEVKKVKR